MTPDGRFVLFTSSANNLVTGGNSLLALNLFVRDRASNSTVLVSANMNGTGGGNANSIYGQVSTNGRFVVFQSDAADLLPGDTNDATDIFMRDLQTGSNILISVAADGGWANAASTDPVMTPDGRYVAFVSEASNLITGDTNGIPDIFVRDLVSQTTTLVSVGAVKSPLTLVQPFIIPSASPVITPDGRAVAFFSTARGLVPGVPSGSAGEVYVRDLVAGNTLWASSNAVVVSGLPTNRPNPFLSYHPVLSDDGRFLAFKVSPDTGSNSAAILQYDSNADSLLVVATNSLPLAFNDDVYGPEMTPDGRFIIFATGTVPNNQVPHSNLYLADTLAGTNVLVSVCQDGSVSTNSASHAPVLSPDGRFVAFLSNTTNLVANTLSNGFHIYLRDTTAGTTALVDADTNGIGFSDEYGSAPSLSANGRLVAFASPDGSLVSQDNNHALDVFVRDTLSASNELISQRAPAAGSLAGNGFSSVSRLSMTPNGRWVVFSSCADDLVTNDFNQGQDVFVRDLVTGMITLVSIGLDGTSASGGDSTSPAISTNGQFVAFASTATNLVPNYTNLFGDVFRRDLVAGTTTLVSVSVDGVTPGNGTSASPTMSQDARYVAFLSTASDLVSPPTTASWNTFWRDLASGVTIALTTNSSAFSSAVFPPSMSVDGRYVAFSYPLGSAVVVWDALNLTNIYTAPATSAAISPNGRRLLYQGNSAVKVADLASKAILFSTFSLASARSSAQWSADERFVTFVARSNVVTGPFTNNQVYLGDLLAGTVALVSDTVDHSIAGNGPSDEPVLSPNGRCVLYRSSATDIAPGTLPGCSLVLYDRATGSNTVLNPGTAGLDWTVRASRPVMDAAAQTVVFQSCQSTLLPADLNRLPDVFAEQPTVTLDSDGDGIPDWWMIKYFGHPTGLAGDLSRAQDDADGDGFTNLQEFLTGTDPKDPASFFHLQISAAVSNTQNVVLSWPAVPGKSYQVQYKNDLNDPLWLNLGGAIVAASSGSLAIPAAQPVVYYRVMAIN